MSKCYIIEQGEYSDYCVVGIFTTRENAEKALRFSEGDEYDPERIVERELDPSVIEIGQGLTHYQVSIYSNGKTTVTKTSCIESGDMRSGSFYVWARDENHAIKIAAERHTKWIMEPRPPRP